MPEKLPTISIKMEDSKPRAERSICGLRVYLCFRNLRLDAGQFSAISKVDHKAKITIGVEFKYYYEI